VNPPQPAVATVVTRISFSATPYAGTPKEPTLPRAATPAAGSRSVLSASNTPHQKPLKSSLGGAGGAPGAAPLSLTVMDPFMLG